MINQHLENIIQAAIYGDAELLKSELEAGTDPDTRYEDWTALWWAIQEGQIEIVKLLLDAGADIEDRDRQNGHSILDKAVGDQQLEIVKLLLDRGIDVNGLTTNGSSLHLAVAYDLHEIIRLLLNHGADLKTRDSEGLTALEFALKHSDKKTIRMLENHLAKSTADYTLFRKYPNIAQAEEMLKKLQENGIDGMLVDNSLAVDVTFFGNRLSDEIELKVHKGHFEKANKLLEKEAEIMLEDVPMDHYLFGFTNEELIEILQKPDEWSVIDYQLAQKILGSRGEKMSEEMIATFKEARLKELAKPEKGQKGWITLGYAAAILGGLFGVFAILGGLFGVFAILSGLFGVFIGWYLYSFKKTLPDGRKVFAHTKKDRTQGKNILFVGIVFLIIYFVSWLIRLSYA